MAEAKVKAEKAERVKLSVPRAGENDDPNLFIGINGKNYIIPKGKISEVPPEVKEEYDRAQEALNRMYEKRDALLGK